MGYIIAIILFLDALLAILGVIPISTALWIASGVVGAVVLFWVALIGFLAWIATR